MTQDKQRLYGAVAAAVIIAGGAGFSLSALMNRGQPAAAEAAEDHAEGEVGHADEAAAGGNAKGGEAGAPEGLVSLTPAQIQASGVKVVSVGRGGGGETRLSGRVEPVIDARASVGSSVSGRIERVLVAPGQTVRAGQGLAILVSADAATFRAEADAAAAGADAARRAYERDRQLGEQGVVARQEVETSRAQSMSAEATARAARARAAAAGAPNAAGRTSINSPIGGVVSSVAVGPGGFVVQGGVVAEVTNPSRVEMVFNAPPAVAAGLRPGAEIRVQGPNGEFGATVTGVAAAANAETGATVVRARPTGAAPPVGSPVTAAVVTNVGVGAPTVPSESIQTVDGATVVFVETSAGFRATPVLAGRQAGGRTEILRGLAGSERVAGANAFLLKAELAKGEAEHGH